MWVSEEPAGTVLAGVVCHPGELAEVQMADG